MIIENIARKIPGIKKHKVGNNKVNEGHFMFIPPGKGH